MSKPIVISTGPKDQLFALIKSLNKAEKRNFKLYANRVGAQKDQLFIQLFDVIDKSDAYDEVQVREKMRNLSKGKLANLKRHLNKQILISLRLIHISKHSDIEIREQMDFARILYGKGLYLQALKLLDRIKIQAFENNHDLLYLEILEFQKLIEERHITRSRQVEGKVESLISEAAKQSRITLNRCRLSNLKIQMHGYFIQHGHIQKVEDIKFLDNYLQSCLQDIEISNLSFFEQVYLHQAYVWYYFILLDFNKCLYHAKGWVKIFDENQHMIELDPALYMRGLHYILTAAFHLKDKNELSKGLEKFESFYVQYNKNFSQISKDLSFIYLNTARINQHFILGTFQQGLKLVPKLLIQLDGLKHSLDQHRIMVFYFKIAYLYFGNGNFSIALDYLNSILNLKTGHLREDIQSYARTLSILTHFELGNYDLIPYLVDQTLNYFQKISGVNEIQFETIKLIKSLVKANPVDHKQKLEDFNQDLIRLAKKPYEKRSHTYIDMHSWVQSQLKNRSIENILEKKN